MNRSRILTGLAVLAMVAAAHFTGISTAMAASKSIYFKNCNSSGWDVDIWVIDTANGADGYEKYLSPGEEVTLTCQDDEKCDIEAAISLDLWELGDVKQSDTTGAQFFIRTVNKFLHVDLYWDKTGSVCYQSY